MIRQAIALLVLLASIAAGLSFFTAGLDPGITNPLKLLLAVLIIVAVFYVSMFSTDGLWFAPLAPFVSITAGTFASYLAYNVGWHGLHSHEYGGDLAAEWFISVNVVLFGLATAFLCSLIGITGISIAQVCGIGIGRRRNTANPS